jgi:hypothetical protein
MSTSERPAFGSSARGGADSARDWRRRWIALSSGSIFSGLGRERRARLDVKGLEGGFERCIE